MLWTNEPEVVKIPCANTAVGPICKYTVYIPMYIWYFLFFYVINNHLGDGYLFQPLFLSEMSVQLESDSETGFSISVTGVNVCLLASSSNERSNWLKMITLAQKHISDTERSQFNRNQSSKYSWYFLAQNWIFYCLL